MLSVPLTAGETISNSYGLNRFMNRVYGWAAVQFTIGIGAAYGLSKVEALQDRPGVCVIGGLVATFVGYIGASWMSPIDHSYEKDGELVRNTKNKPLRVILYGLGTIGMGMSLAPLLREINPDIVVSALAITGGLFGGASLVAYSLPKNKLFSYYQTLQGCLLGLVLIGFIGGGIRLFMGENPVTNALIKLDNIAGIAIFTLYMMMDTHLAIKNYEDGYADHLGVSIQFVLNAWNIFVRLLSLMDDSDRRRRK